MPHRSVNAADGGEGERLHKELGKPTVPVLIADGRLYPLLHTSQIASVLGLSHARSHDLRSNRLGWDCVNILESWSSLLGAMSWELMLTPTRSRGRTPRNLTVNVFHPFELVPGAWDGGSFEWHTEESDARREAELHDEESVHGYVRRCLMELQSFLLDKEDQLDERDPTIVTSSRGEAPFSVLLDAQRTHAATHHRQLVDFLDDRGRPAGQRAGRGSDSRPQPLRGAVLR